MKRNLSVLMLMNQLYLPWTLLAMVLLVLANCIACLCFGSGKGFYGDGIEFLSDIWFVLCLLLYAAYATRPVGGEMTTMRLRISQRQFVLVSWGGAFLHYLCLYFTEICSVVVLAKVCEAGADYLSGPQGLLTDFYRSEALHFILPLEDPFLWVSNLLYLTAISGLAAVSVFLDRDRQLEPMEEAAVTANGSSKKRYLSVRRAMSIGFMMGLMGAASGGLSLRDSVDMTAFRVVTLALLIIYVLVQLFKADSTIHDGKERRE